MYEVIKWITGVCLNLLNVRYVRVS